MAEELKLEVTSNLDELLKQVRQLKKENANLGTSYKKLQEQVSNSSKGLKSSFNELNNVNRVVERFKNVTEEAQKKNDEAWSSGVAKLKEFHQSYKNLQNAVVSGSVRLSSSVARLSSSMTPMSPADIGSGFSLSPTNLFGTADAVKNAFSLMKEMQQMRHDLAYLSNSAGNAGEALSTVFSIASGSAISRGTATGVVRALADQGLQLYDSAGKVSPRIERLGKLSGDLQAATGIAASQWAAFTGELSANYGLPEEGITSITSALVGTGLRAQNLERAMSTVNKVLANTAYVAGVPTKDSMLGLTKSIGSAMAVMTHLGLSAEKAGSTIEGMLDPENIEKNAYLFSKLGISMSEYGEYLNQANGQQLLLQRVMSNLPELAKQIASIRNPFGRVQFAKSLGLDMQLVQRMANASGEELQRIQDEYAAQNKNQEALEKKKKFMAAESAKFDDYLFNLKMKVLSPIMQMLSSGMLSDFMGVLPTLAESMAKTFVAVTPIAKVLADAFVTYSPLVFKFATLMADVVGMLFGPAGLGVTGTPIQETVSRAYDSATKRLNETGVDFASILSVLSKIYLAVKAFQFANFFVSTAKSLGGFVGAGIEKVLGWISPRQKLVMNATVGDLADAIKTSVNPGGGTSLSGGFLSQLLSSVVLAFGGIGVATLLFKLLFGSKSTKEIEDLTNLGSVQGSQRQQDEASSNFYKDVGLRGFQAFGGATLLGGKVVLQSVRGANEAMKLAATELTTEYGSILKVTETLGKKATLRKFAEVGKEGFVKGAALEAGIGKAISSRILLPLSVALTTMDWVKVFDSDQSTKVQVIRGAAALANTVGTYLTVATALEAASIVALPGAGVTGVGAGASFGVGFALNTLADYFDNTEKIEQQKAAVEKAFNLEQNKVLKEVLTEVATGGVQQKVSYGGGKSGGEKMVSFAKPEVGKYETYADYTAAVTTQLNSKEFQLDLSRFHNAANLTNTLQEKFLIGEERFLKERYATALLSTDMTVIEAEREKLKQHYMEKQKVTSEQAVELINQDFETLEKTRELQAERREQTKQEIVKTTDLFKTLYESFKVGNFGRIFEILQTVFDQIKLTFLQIYNSIPGLTTASTIELGKNLFGENFTKGESFRRWYLLGMRDEDDFKKFLNEEIRLKKIALNDQLRIVDEENKVALEKQAKDEKMKEAERLAREKAIKATEENTKVTKDLNTTIDKKSLTAETRVQLQRDYIGVVFGE